MRAAIYTRISDDRDGTAAGVARQQADCRALAEARGWPVDDTLVFVDNDVSAYRRGPRPAYRRLYDAAKAGQIDVIVVWHLDRLYRHPVELEEIIDLVEATGVQLVTVTGGDYDLTTTDGRAMARVVVTFARKESEDKARRTRRKHLELAQAGQPVGGGRPFGYEPDRITIRPDEAAHIREACQRILAGDTLRSIALDWQRRDIRTPPGGRFQPTRLRRILLSHRIAGWRSLGDEGPVIAKAAWPAIVDDDTHRRVRAILKAPGRQHAAGGITARRYLLPGFLHCHRCGKPLTSRKQTARRNTDTYVCDSGPVRGGCGGLRVVADPLDRLVVDMVIAALDSPQLADAVNAHTGDPDAQAQLLDRIAGDEAALDDLARDHYAERIITKSEYLAARQALEARLHAARSQLRQHAADQAPKPWAGQGGALRQAWPAMTLDQQRAVIASVIERITIGPGTPGLARFDPGRVQVTWRV